MEVINKNFLNTTLEARDNSSVKYYAGEMNDYCLSYSEVLHL